jgi:hypothetical protein
MRQLLAGIAHYNEIHPLDAFVLLSSRELICLSRLGRDVPEGLKVDAAR